MPLRTRARQHLHQEGPKHGPRKTLVDAACGSTLIRKKASRALLEPRRSGAVRDRQHPLPSCRVVSPLALKSSISLCFIRPDKPTSRDAKDGRESSIEHCVSSTRVKKLSRGWSLIEERPARTIDPSVDYHNCHQCVATRVPTVFDTSFFIDTVVEHFFFIFYFFSVIFYVFGEKFRHFYHLKLLGHPRVHWTETARERNLTC